MVDALAGQGVIGTFASPRDPGTASIAWHHSSGRLTGYPGAWTYVRGGMGRVSFALADAAREAGAVIATGVPVGAIRPGEGVELEDGTRVAGARRSSATPTRGGRWRCSTARRRRGFRERVEAVPSESPVLKVNFALVGHPALPAGRPRDARDGQRDRRRRRAGPRVPARRRPAGSPTSCGASCTSRPWPTRASPRTGRHVMSAFCQYVPYRLAEGTWDERRDEIADRVETSIERFAPGFRDLVVEREALAPPDVETKIGLTGGHIFQGECLPEHMWDRRLAYRTGAEGVYLCGAGTYPGGSVIAVNGRNAALAVDSDLVERGVGCASRIPCNAQGSGGSTVPSGRIPG